LTNSSRRLTTIGLLGPAIVAGVAYLDPGNVATNLTAGSSYGFLLVWVIIAANLAAALVQFLSAKLGLVTGESLPGVLGQRFKSRPARLAFWAQAELVAMATDLAEIIGGALALYLLFDLPLFVGGLITSVVSILMLQLGAKRGVFSYQSIIISLVAITAIGFVAGLFVNPPQASDILSGMVPRVIDQGSLLLVVGIFGATIMPHAIYAHSALVRDRFGSDLAVPEKLRVLKVMKWDVGIAMTIAGFVNLAILLVGAVNLFGVVGTETIEGAHKAIESSLGVVIATTFAIGLLASGLASTSIGAYAGSVIMGGLLKAKVPLLARRIVSLIPALIILALTNDATWALVLSQVLLSFGIPFALFPLIRLTSISSVMGEFKNKLWVSLLGYLIAGVVSSLNLTLLWLTLFA
jgi:manganese transport protein